MHAMLDAVRDAVTPRVWGAAVGLARDGAVVGISDDGDEIHLRVKARGRALPHEVYLWPDDADWGCDCAKAGSACLHVCAAVIAHNRALIAGKALPEPEKSYRVRLRYDLTSVGSRLALRRSVVWPDGRVEPLEGTLADNQILVGRGDTQAESLLVMQSGSTLDAETLRRLIRFLEGASEATLDGAPIRLDPEPVMFRVRVTDADEGFKVGLYRPTGIDALFRGAARVGVALHPTSHGSLTPEQRRALIQGVIYLDRDVGRMVNEYLPRIAERIPVDIKTARLPNREQMTPAIILHMREVPLGLELRAEVVYGGADPVARVEKGVLRAIGKVVPARDLGAERTAVRKFEALTGLSVGIKTTLPPERAAEFLSNTVPRIEGPIKGRVHQDRFRIVHSSIEALVAVRRVENERTLAAWELDVHFSGPDGEADPYAVLEAWRRGRTLVPLLDGGFAPLPADWLEEHGTVLRELMEGRDGKGRVDKNATAALVELLEGTEADVPPDLSTLRTFLDEGRGLPDVELPDGFTGVLRPYQQVGYSWLAFLRQMDIGGILADDMGLGKTVQTLAAMLAAGGKSLVVAPTSVIRNWQREIERFTPSLSVNIYHGPQRALDDSDVTLTSYTLLRLDLDTLRQTEWTYAVLDEAQFIKNADSQTARAAYQLRAHHRLALTGTPVENRLEELWSQFRFLMPGLLGSKSAFRDRFVRPIEAGDRSARGMLHRRVRPYVLRRLKVQVAPELPKLTDMIIRCTMDGPQRKVYEAVRLAAREDVQRAIQERGHGRGTIQVLEALLRMRQACCDPALLPGTTGDGAASCKLDRLEDLLVEIICEDHKALIFSQWTGLLDRVEPRLKKLGIPWVRLDGATRDRQKLIDDFQSPSGPPVFLLSLKAGGTGLNLTAADYVVHLDPWWNPAVQQQATDRAHRIGQDKPVVSCRFIAEDSVEERILELQDAKRDLAEAALGTEGGFVKALSATELRSLFDGAL